MRAFGRSTLVGVLSATVIVVFASSAGAVVFHSSSGQFFGVALRDGVSPTSVAGLHLPSATGPSPFKSNGNMDYNGGPVLHSTSPYLIFWDPSGKIPAASEAVMSKYLADVAADDGKATNVFSVLRQYTDTKGVANYHQIFSSSHAIVDTQAYPANGCQRTATAYPICITDPQIQGELTRLIAQLALPRGTGTNAPMYAVITPQDVNICFASSGTSCASNAFCAYHSNFADGGKQVLYSIDPFIVWALNATKGCQTDGTAKYQSPNSPADHAYQINDNMSHEMSETITDPLGTAWWNNDGGNEIGDNCATFGAAAPLNGTSPLAYAPTLGGSASTGNLFDQVVNGTDYYNQTEWSNGDINCKAMNTAGTIVATFSTTGSLTAGSTISFDPSGSSSSKGYSSTSWSFGDGKSSFSRAAPATVTHVFAAAGTYKVVLTLVDTVGNLKQFVKSLTIT